MSIADSWYRAYCALLLFTLHFSMIPLYPPLHSLSLSLAFSFSFSLSLSVFLSLSLSLPFSETWGHLHSDIFGQFAPPRVSIVQKKLVDHNKSGSHDYIKHDQSIRALSEFDML